MRWLGFALLITLASHSHGQDSTWAFQWMLAPAQVGVIFDAGGEFDPQPHGIDLSSRSHANGLYYTIGVATQWNESWGVGIDLKGGTFPFQKNRYEKDMAARFPDSEVIFDEELDVTSSGGNAIGLAALKFYVHKEWKTGAIGITTYGGIGLRRFRERSYAFTLREPGTNYFKRYGVIDETKARWHPHGGAWFYFKNVKTFQLVLDVAYSQQDFNFAVAEEDHLGNLTNDRIDLSKRYLTFSVGIVVRAYQSEWEEYK